MSKFNLKELKKVHSMKVLSKKEILTLQECMVWYDVSYVWILKQIKYYDIPRIDKGKGSIFFDKKAVNQWLRKSI